MSNKHTVRPSHAGKPKAAVKSTIKVVLSQPEPETGCQEGVININGVEYVKKDCLKCPFFDEAEDEKPTWKYNAGDLLVMKEGAQMSIEHHPAVLEVIQTDDVSGTYRLKFLTPVPFFPVGSVLYHYKVFVEESRNFGLY